MNRMDDWNYHRDPRTWDLGPEPYEVLEAGPSFARVELHEELLEDLVDDGILCEDHDGILTAETHYEVCERCSGSGKMVNPAIDAGGIAAATFREDPDFEQDYWSGRYDVQCSACSGKRVQPALEFPAAIQKAIDNWRAAQWDDAALRAAERAMGA